MKKLLKSLLIVCCLVPAVLLMTACFGGNKQLSPEALTEVLEEMGLSTPPPTNVGGELYAQSVDVEPGGTVFTTFWHNASLEDADILVEWLIQEGYNMQGPNTNPSSISWSGRKEDQKFQASVAFFTTRIDSARPKDSLMLNLFLEA